MKDIPQVEKDLSASFEMIDDVLSREIHAENIQLQNRKLNKLCLITANASHNIAIAKELLYKKQLIYLQRIENDHPSAKYNVINKYLQGYTARYEGYYTRADRQFAAINHSIDAIRSILSKYKSELEHQIISTHD